MTIPDGGHPIPPKSQQRLIPQQRPAYNNEAKMDQEGLGATKGRIHFALSKTSQDRQVYAAGDPACRTNDRVRERQQIPHGEIPRIEPLFGKGYHVFMVRA